MQKELGNMIIQRWVVDIFIKFRSLRENVDITDAFFGGKNHPALSSVDAPKSLDEGIYKCWFREVHVIIHVEGDLDGLVDDEVVF
jgi:hypothetical protein